MRRLISLGLSCQARFSINLVNADHRRLPFDFNITTKPALLEQLGNGGAAFRFETPERLEIYRTPEKGVEGPRYEGIFFWHDIPRIAHREIVPNWAEHLERVRQRYAHNWAAFQALARDPDAAITFVLSNAQNDLGEYCADAASWDRDFRLDAPFYRALSDALRGFGARNFDILFLNRSLTDSIEANYALAAEPFLSVFAGVQKVPVNDAFAISTLLTAGREGPSVKPLAGRYEDGREIIALGEDRAAIRVGRAPVGEVRSALAGYMAVFNDGEDRVLTAVAEGPDIYWSDKTRWRRAT